MEDLSDLEYATNPTVILLWAFLSIPHIVLVGLLVFAVVVLMGGSVLAAYDVTRFLWSRWAKTKKNPSEPTSKASPPPSRKGDDSSTPSSPRDTGRLKLIARRIPPLPLPPTLNTPKANQYTPYAHLYLPSPPSELAPEDLYECMRHDSELSTPRNYSL